MFYPFLVADPCSGMQYRLNDVRLTELSLAPQAQPWAPGVLIRSMSDPVWAESLANASQETIAAVTAALEDLVLATTDLCCPPIHALPEGRARRHLEALIRLWDGLGEALPDGLSPVRHVLNLPKGSFLDSLPVVEGSLDPHAPVVMRALFDRLKDEFGTVAAIASANGAASGTRLNALQAGLLAPDAGKGPGDSSLQVFGLRDAVACAEFAAAQARALIETGVLPRDIAVLSAGDPRHLAQAFTAQGVPLSGLPIASPQRDIVGETALHLLLAKRPPTPAMVLASLALSPLMPWAPQTSRDLAEMVMKGYFRGQILDTAPEQKLLWEDLRATVSSLPQLRFLADRICAQLAEGDAVRARMPLPPGDGALDWETILRDVQIQPPTVDETARSLEGVSLRSASESPWRPCGHLIVSDFTEGFYPTRPKANPLFLDSEIEAIRTATGLELQGRAVGLSRSLALFKEHLCATSKSVTFLVPWRDLAGARLAPSAGLSLIARVISGLDNAADLITDISHLSPDDWPVAHYLPATANEPIQVPEVLDFGDRSLLTLRLDEDGRTAPQSPSRLETLVVSPLAWLLEEIGAEQSAWVAETLDIKIRGTIAHHVFEKVFPEDAPLPDPADLPGAVEAMFEQAIARHARFLRGTVWEMERTGLHREILEAALRWRGHLGELGAKIVGNELWLRGEAYGIRLHGKADTILQMSDGTLLVVDHKKSGSSARRKRMQAGWDLQVGLYRDMLARPEPREGDKMHRLIGKTVGIAYHLMNDGGLLTSGIALRPSGPARDMGDEVNSKVSEHLRIRLEQVGAGKVVLNTTGDEAVFRKEGGFMRLSELTVENYGAFASRTVKIPERAGLTIVYGANEAGKSTSLEAISDFLFSIPKNTQRGNLFGYDGMRIGASMLMSDGTTLTLRRRKGNGKTLADPSGTAVDDAVLGPVLGAITRERFETLFALNHETLRKGGEQLLDADGDIGRLIVEAGGGLRTLVSRLEDIDKETNTLFDTRKSASRVFYQHLSAFEAADKTARGAQLTQQTYEQTRKAALAAEKNLEDLRAERRGLGTSTSRLERVLRVAPYLRQVDSLAQECEAFEDVASFPDDFAASIRTALNKRSTANERLESAIERRDRLKAKLDALVVNPALKAAEERLRDLAERAIHVSKARLDRANRQREIDHGEAQLAALRRMLGLATNADLAPLLPDQAALDRVRRLADEMVERRPLLAGAEADVEELAEKLAVLDARLGAARTAGFDAPPEASSATFGSLAAQQSALQVRQQALKTEREVLTRRLTALGFDSIEALTSLVCPSADEIRSEQAAHEALASQIEDEAKRQRQAEYDQAAAERDIEELQASGIVASDASLSEARSHRVAVWKPIKSAYVAGQLPEDAAVRLSAADSVEAAILSADELADRRATEAERAAALHHAQRRITDAKAAKKEAEAEAAAISIQLEARRTAWASSFPQVGAKYPELASLLQFAQTRQQLLDDFERLRGQANALAIDEAQLSPTVELLERAEQILKLDPALSFTARVAALQNAVSRHEQAHADFLRDIRDQEDTARQHKLLVSQLKQLSEEQEAWEAAWPAATAALGLGAEITPANAISAVTEWAGARGVLSAIGQVRHRLQRMDEDETSLAADVRSLAADLALEVGDDCVVAAQTLMSRFNDNATAQTQYDGILPDFEEAKVEVEQAQEELGAASDALAALAASARLDCENEAALLDVATRCEKRGQLREEIALTERTATDVGDKLDLAALRAEWNERDLDEIRAELNEHTARISEVENEIEAAVLEQKAAGDALDAYLSQSEVNHAVAEREAAAAQMHLALERYLELAVARELVTSAMVTIRAEQQDPLVQRAGELFAATTLGEFTGIETDIDEKGQPVVVGRRANGGIAPVTTMSDGTRDQLFLAFRLASLENYGGATEPLPFIADDILVHFDDERSRSTLGLLAEFGKSNQVLLFTHHRSVRALAEPLEAQGHANIIDLERAV